MAWTLADIRRKFRQVTGRLSSNQLSDNLANTYINNYYQFEFPAEVKLDRQHTYYEFNTVANQQTYTFTGATYTNIEPPVYLDLMPLLYYQDPTVYYQENPEQISRFTPWTGDGTTTAFTTTEQVPFILPGTVIVTDNVETFTDDGNGVLTGDQGGTGSVNYTTGAIAVNFVTAPADGQNIPLSFEQLQPGRPTSVLYYNNEFRFYTVPDTVYRVQIKAYKVPDAMVDGTDTPVLQEWGECIAFGAARQLLVDYGETERYAEITQLYKEQVSYILARTVQNLMNTRARPMF